MEGSSSKPLDFQYVMEHVQHVLRPANSKETRRDRTHRLWGAAGEAPSGKRKRLNTDTSEPSIASEPLKLPQERPHAPHSTVAIARSVEEGSDSISFCSRPLLPLELAQLAKPYADRLGAYIRSTSTRTADLNLSQVEADLEAYVKGLAKDVATKRECAGLERGDTPESAAAARSKLIGPDGFEECIQLMDLGLCPTQMQLEAFVN